MNDEFQKIYRIKPLQWRVNVSLSIGDDKSWIADSNGGTSEYYGAYEFNEYGAVRYCWDHSAMAELKPADSIEDAKEKAENHYLKSILGQLEECVQLKLENQE